MKSSINVGSEKKFTFLQLHRQNRHLADIENTHFSRFGGEGVPLLSSLGAKLPKRH